MLPKILLVFVCCLISSGWSATLPIAMNITGIDSTTAENVSSEIKPIELQTTQPNVTINLNCSCIISTPNLKGSKVIIPGLIVNGKSNYHCNQKTFNDCKHACVSKRDEPIFNVDSRSVGINIANGVNLNAFLCSLMDRGDSSTMVSITTRMDCTEKSTNFELFNSQSNSVSMSPSSSLNCPVTMDSNDAISTAIPSIVQSPPTTITIS